MDPWFPDNAPDGRRTGVFIDRDMNELLKGAPIVIACAN
jgi:hypothetical protein